MSKHPMQPVVFGDDFCGGKPVIRFQKNKIIRWLFDRGDIHLNKVALNNDKFDDDDRMQLAQLIGYSISSYGSLSYVTKENLDEATEKAFKLVKEAEKQPLVRCPHCGTDFTAPPKADTDDLEKKFWAAADEAYKLAESAFKTIDDAFNKLKN